MSAHTPGPWAVNRTISAGNQSLGFVVTGPRDGSTNPVCYGSDNGKGEIDANARLIAAAPELLAIAEDFEITEPDGDGLVWLVLHGGDNGPKAMFNLGKSDRLAVQVALKLEEDRRAAIAKARGAA